MKNTWAAILTLAVRAGLLAVPFSMSAFAQEEDIEAAIGPSRSGVSVRVVVGTNVWISGLISPAR